MFAPYRVAAVVQKEAQELIRNWMSFLLAIIAPLILYFLFAFGMPLEVKNIPMAVLDEDRSPDSRRLIESFACAKVFQIKQTIDRFDEIDAIIRRGDIRLCVVIPPRFGENLQKGIPQKIVGYVDGTFPLQAQMSSGYLEGTVARFSDRVLGQFFLKNLGPSYGAGTGLPVSTFVSPWFNPTFRSEDFIVPGVIAIILIFLPPTVAALSLAREKETGSILNMFCSPITKTEYILGKAIPYIAITYFNFLVFFALTILVFKVPMRGSWPLLLSVSFLYVVVVIGLGLFVAVLVKTQIAAILITCVVNMIPSFMFSGFMLPVLCMDESGKQTAYALSPTHYISFIRKLMLKGVGLEYLWQEIATLFGMALFFYVTSIVLFKKRLE
ncbi:MAG: ABC transporter permease [Candidatus Riflebacteria bacterium]|nr:ABC transporter permease [Candidatus Riflebacteria bacterium]